MRKLVSVAIVCLMTLTLFGLFGGVVEEGEGIATYDPGNNTIYVTGMGNSLLSIFLDIGNVSIFNVTPPNTYITHANIQINISSNLTVSAGEVLKFNTGLKMTVSGFLDVNGIEGLLATFTSNNTTPSSGDWQGVIFNTTEASNSNLNYLNISYATVGIYCDGSSPTIANSIITECSDNGVLSDGGSPTINDVEISHAGDGDITDAGLYVISSSPFIENSTFINNPDRDILLQSDSHPVLLNSSFNSAIIADINSNLTVKWYLHVLVEDNITGSPIQGATVWVRDFYNNLVVGSPFTTNAQGVVNWIQVIEYIRSSSTTTPFTPHNITATHDEYYNGYAEPEPYMDSSKQVQINLTMIRRDLTTTSSDISFLPLGIPIAGENLTVYVIIYNVEVDDAQSVRVKIFDNITGVSEELYHIIIPEIKGYGSYEISKRWKPTPGTHMIEVFIDPNDEINEINSTMPPGWAENNNYASINISVNARPIVNISEPVNNSEVNGTIMIEGTSWDDPADNVFDLPGNDIARIDLRLEGYDWISFPPFIFNISSGGWDWFYNWDTTQWNGTPLSDGNYTINARAWDNYHFSHFYNVNISINNTGANEPPVAIISEPLNNSFFSVNESIKFNGSSSYDPNNDALTYEWDFGDGNFAYDNITYHSFSQIGIYNVTLTVNDSQVQNYSYVTVIIDNNPPYANVTSSVVSEYVNQTITFFGYNSTDEETPVLTFFWDYDDTEDTNGDGNFTNDIDNLTTTPIENTTHSYSQSGTYTVTLTVWDGIINSTDTVTVTIQPNDPPNAVIDEPNALDTFNVNQTIIFNASSSSDLNDEDLEYYWDFGDGTNSWWMTEPVTTHYYSDFGPNVFPLPPLSYTLTLEVRDDEGLNDTSTIFIIVNNYPPVAIATSNVTTAPTNQDITFNGTDSYDPEGFGISSYLWDFGDGVTSTQSVFEHSYAQDGIYNVTLTVTDIVGANDTDWIIITISNRPPIIENVTTYPESPKINEEIYINITATDDGEIVNYSWDFDDGETYYENNKSSPGDGAFDGSTSHSYSSKTTYTVTITVEDDDGETASTQITITIVNSPPEVNITFPTEGKSVSGTITIQGTSSDFDGAVEKVEVRIDSGVWEIADDTSGNGSLYTWSYSWNTEDDVTNGQHTIYAVAYDSESNTDPPASVTVDVNNLPSSITVTANLNPSTVDAGGTVNVNGVVTYNTGESVADAEVNISIQGEDVYWITTTASNGQYSWDITAPGEGGSFIVRVDATKDSFSNFDRETLTVTSLPDLAITASDIVFDPPDPSSGETVQIIVTVFNNGDEDANNVLVNAYDGDPDEGGDPIQPDDSKTINLVSAGGTKNVIFDWDTTDISGDHNIYIVVDPNDSIAESNENNNEAFRFIDIQGKPDFTLDSADISFSNNDPKVDEIINIFIKIHNDGDESDTVRYDVYDGDPEADGILIDTGQDSIPANGDKNVQVDWTIEKSGVHDIYVILDPDDDVEESDEYNNDAFKSITVEALPEDGGIPSWFIGLTVVIVVVVFILIYFLRLRERGQKPEKKLPIAKVVQKEGKEGEKDEEKKEEDKTLIDSHGGVRI